MLLDIPSPMNSVRNDQLALSLVAICLENTLQILCKSFLCITKIRNDQVALNLVAICLENTLQILCKSFLCITELCKIEYSKIAKIWLANFSMVSFKIVYLTQF